MSSARKGKGRTGYIIFLIVFSAMILLFPVWRTYIQPELCRVPEELQGTLYLEGEIGVMNEEDILFEKRDALVEIDSHVADSTDDVIVLKIDTTTYDPATGEKLPDIYQTDTFRSGIDRRKGVYVGEYSDNGNERGLWKFPYDSEKRDYEVWNPEINDTSKAKYVGEGAVDELDCFKYRVYEDRRPVELQGAELSYHADKTYWVEPKSGIVVDMEQKTELGVPMPNLRILPRNLSYDFHLKGVLDVRNESTLKVDRHRVDIYDSIRKTDEFENGYVLKLSENIEMYDRDDGERLFEDRLERMKFAVDRRSGRYVNGYGGERREGLWIFPLKGVEPRNYGIWNEEVGAVSQARFLGPRELFARNAKGEEEREDSYFFEIREKDHEPEGKSAPLTSRYIDSVIRFWVEPTTGIILKLSKYSEQTVSVINSDGLFESEETEQLIYRLNASLSEQQVYDNIRDVKKLKKVIQYSSGEMPIYSSDLRYTPETEEELTEKAREARTALIVIDDVIPNGLLIIGLVGVPAVIVRRRRRSWRRAGMR